MNTSFPDDYDREKLRRIRTSRFGFDLWVTPRFEHHYADGAYEEMTALLVRQLVRRAACFIDVGAHYGFYSVLAGLSNPDCAILAFEPVPENAGVLRMNLALHGISGDLEEVALTDRCGHASFQVSGASDNSGFVANPKGGVLKTVEVRTGTLDEYLQRIPKGPVVAKIDTEGNEPKVVAGMKELLRSYEDVRLVIELNPACLEANGFAPEQLLEVIDDSGLDMFFVDDQAMIFQRYRRGDAWQPLMRSRSFANVLCVPRHLALNLCIFSHSSGLEGAERSLLELVDALVSERGDLCTVVLPSAGPLTEMLNDRGAAVFTADFDWWCAEETKSEGAIREQMARSSSRIVGLVPLIAEIQPDVVVTNTMVVPWGAVTAAMLDLPHIWWVKEFGELDHDLKFFMNFDKVIEAMAASSTHILVNSEAVKDCLFARVDPARCTVAYNDRIAFSGDPVTGRSYFSRPGSTKILFAGRATPAKGLDDAIHATRRLADRGHDVELCVVGKLDTPFGRDMRRLVGDLGIEDRVRFAGFVDNVRDVMEQADVVVMCSKREAFGRVTAEAMLLGKAFIGTRSGGTVELIDDGATGLLYAPGDSEELAEKILYFVERPDAIREFGERARASIVSKLQEKPVSAIMHSLCRKYKGAQGPAATSILVAFLAWQAGGIDQLDEILNRTTGELRSREQHQRSLETRIAASESELQELRTRTSELEASLSERDGLVERLAAQAKELEEQLESSQASLAEREGQLGELDARAVAQQERIGVLTADLSDSREQLDARNRLLEDIVASRAWRVADFLWRVRMRLAPPGSLRGRMWDRLLRTGR